VCVDTDARRNGFKRIKIARPVPILAGSMGGVGSDIGEHTLCVEGKLFPLPEHNLSCRCRFGLILLVLPPDVVQIKPFA
jgi:hypothetical protein